jgi:hypothetical protein
MTMSNRQASAESLYHQGCPAVFYRKRLSRSGDPDSDPRAGAGGSYRRPAVRELVPSDFTGIVHEAVAGRGVPTDLSDLQMLPQK